MATSYANTGGSGNRTSIITVTLGGTYAGSPSILVNGVLSEFSSWFSATTEIKFEFTSYKKIIDEAKFYQSGTNTHGTWKWQGSNDGTSWTDIGSSFTLGGVATQTITALSGNTTEYRFYRLTIVSGATSSGPYIFEFEFKIEDGSPITFVTEPIISQYVVEIASAPVPPSAIVSQLVVELASESVAPSTESIQFQIVM